ncbi:hypothetical protein [Zoogloea sp.]|uniref:hypothetical protein n=1 Tax=Zoogloea sp. TaxID=49181 RepID=UPI001415C227|nr:MAG: hypothetical protein F9K15_17355 [Zoogloea sp.]
MHQHVLILRALCALALAPCEVRADDCERLPKPTVTLKRHQEAFALDLRTSFRTLTLLGPAGTRPGMKVLGLTRGTAIVSFQTRIVSYVDPGGRWECASPQLTVTYGFSPMTVYVAREFPQGSCAWNEIHRHELRHVRAYQEHLEGIEPELREALQRRFVTGDPWRGPVGQARNRIQQELEERWAPYVKRMINKVDLAQALIDTPEEYARVASSCAGEIRRLTR